MEFSVGAADESTLFRAGLAEEQTVND